MPRFLSRAGTNIDDLERQLARVGSADNDTSADEPPSIASPRAHEQTPLLATAAPQLSTASPCAEYTSLALDRCDAPGGQKNKQSRSGRWPEGTGDASLSLVCAGEQQSHAPRGSMRPDLAAAAITSDAPRKLGTWDGVFMPVMLSIWGILVYVRMGYFLSQVGILGTIGGFGCGYLVTTMTTLSISAISTNGTVKGGGPYYMLSRSLGPEFGGSIGLMFYAGTMLAGALNAVAFVEPLMSNLGQATGDMARVLPEGQRWHIFYSSVLLALCTTVCLTGAQVFARASTLLSTVIIASIAMVLASFALKAPFANEERAVYYTGWSVETFMENLWPDLSPISRGQPAETFSTVLGVLFPACIGIMAGASMSSQLRKPSKSIPKGTLWAVLLTFVLYLLVATALGATTRRESLRRNFNILQEINLVPAIVPIGAITTSVTSTLSGLLSAASILQAIAKDDLFALLKPLKVLNRNDSPTRAIVTTYVFSQLAFFVGDTNAVAPFTTMFNLIMFAFVNLACLVLKLAASVNFRPTFRFFKAWTAALGALGCFSTMLFVDMLSALTSTAVVVVLFVYVHYTCPPKPWGDVTQSLIYHQCRKFMLRLDARKDHVKFWRPQILLLVHNPRSSLQLIRFCNALKKGGLYVIGHVIKGEFRSMATELQRQEAAWLQLIDVLRVKAFLNMAVDTEDAAGARSLVFGAGLGGMRPNIVVMGFLNGHAQGCEVTLPTDAIRLNTPISATGYLRIIEDVLTMGKALGIAYGFSRLGPAMPGPAAFAKPTRTKYIDLWPIQVGTATAALSADGQHTYLTNFDSYVMVLQLGTVLHLVPFWNKHYRLRVMCFVEDPGDVDEEYRRVAKLLRDLRVVADLRVHHMRGAGLTTYDQARAGEASGPKNPSLPPNSRAVQMAAASDEPIAFSMRVNLPMPLRYEATRLEQASSSQRSTAESSSSSSELGSDSDSDSDPLDTSDVQPRRRISLQPPFSSDARKSVGSGGLLSLQRIKTVSHQPAMGSMPPTINTRRRSDGSMVLANLYPHALASMALSPAAHSKQHEAEAPGPGAEFNDMPIATQNRILNELMRRESNSESTALIFTTLQAPEPGTSESELKTSEYLRDIDTLAHGLPPVFLVHATSLTVTTSL